MKSINLFRVARYAFANQHKIPRPRDPTVA